MIKIGTLLAIGSIVLTCVVGVPRVEGCINNYKEMQSNTDVLKALNKDIKNLTPLLQNYQNKFQGTHLNTNEEIAKTVSKLKGCSIKSISSYAKDSKGKLVECSQVTNIQDVMYFSQNIEQMRFSVIVTNLPKFLKSLDASAIAVNNLEVTDKDACIGVNTVFQEPVVTEREE